jgi:hypothetical protein
VFTDLTHERAYQSAARRASTFASVVPTGSVSNSYWRGFRNGMVAWQNAKLGNALTREQEVLLARLTPSQALYPNVTDAAWAAGFLDGRCWEAPAGRPGLRRLVTYLESLSISPPLSPEARRAIPSLADWLRGSRELPESELHEFLAQLDALQ